MKKLKQILAVAALVFCCSMVVKADTKAAQITGVKQIDDSTGSIVLSCDLAIGTAYYALDLSTDNQTWTCVGRSSNPNYISVTGLSAGQTYYARVTGASQVNSATNGTYTYTPSTDASDPIEVVTAPSTTNVAVAQSNATINSVSVNVTQVTGANYYKIVYDKQIIGQGTSSNVTSSVPLNPGVRYWVSVYPCRRANAGTGIEYIAEGYSKSLYLKTVQPKLNKTNFAVANAWLNIDTYRLVVNSGYTADGYQFQFQNTAGKVKKTFETSYDYVNASNLKGTFYKYRVRSYVNCGSTRAYSAWSDFKAFALAKKVSLKSAKGKLKLNWSKVNGATGYTIYISNKENSGYKKVKALSAKKRSITISKMGKKKLKKNTTYYVRIIPKAKKLAADSYGCYYIRAY